MTLWVVYCHTHVETGRRYIGITQKTWQHRWHQHCAQAVRSKGRWSHFANAIRKYGKSAFAHDVLETHSSLEEANAAEERLIERFRTRDPNFGFNLMRGGGHVPHPVKNPWLRPEYRAKSVAAAKARWDDPEYRLKCEAVQAKRWGDPIKRAEQSVRSKELMSDPAIRLASGKGTRGRHLSEEHRAKIGAAGRSRDPELIERIAAKLRGRPLTEEHRAKIGVKSAGRSHAPETLAKISVACKGMKPSPSAIANSVASRKNRARLRTHFHCRSHGPIPLSECYRRKSGRAECIQCRQKNGEARRRVEVRVSAP